MSTLQKDFHAFVAARPGDSRAPCPALNALANHGYLPRDGRNIGLFQLIGALRKVYNVSIPLAVILAVGGFIKCSHSFFSLHLSDLNTHGKIEHNASLAHLDVHEGDPTIVNRPLLQQLLADSSDGVGLTVEDFVKARVRREAPLQTPLHPMHAEFSRGEVVMVRKLFGEGPNMVVSKERAETFYGEERLPEGWRATRVQGLLSTRHGSQELAKLIADAKKSS